MILQMNNTWDIYPRPQMVRDSFLNLNGMWDFKEAGKTRPSEYNEKICVPYPMESELSGINRSHSEDKYIWYRTYFDFERKQKNSHVFLRCGGIDRRAKVWLNGKKLPGLLSFINDEIELFELKDHDNELVIRVHDSISDNSIPYGKQSKNPSGMWYTPVSGIWQTVWIEEVPAEYIRNIKILPEKDGVLIKTYGIKNGVITLEGGDKYRLHDGICRIKPKKLIRWSPDNPYLYHFTLSAKKDVIKSYFAVRTLAIEAADGKNRLYVNGKKEFFHGLLDQGYWPEGIYTPGCPEKYSFDIKLAKDMGFNMLRKHIKVEPEVFYYLCDIHGMYVFQDMVNNGDYSFIRDTALPTFGFKWLPDYHLHSDMYSRAMFYKYARQTVKRLYNHPSIVYWTIFNEGWGQFHCTKMYEIFKKWDPSRFVDSASGWFKCGKTDISSWHVYFHRFFFPFATDKPVVLSEFGGYALKIKEHSHDPHKLYGYAKFKNPEKYSKAILKLYERDVFPFIKEGLCSDVYTQLSDVETEENGLVTYDRQVIKPDLKIMQLIAKSIKEKLQ